MVPDAAHDRPTPATDRRGFVAAAAAGLAVLGGQPTGAGEPTMTVTFRDHLLRCLGGPWPAPCDLQPRVLETIPRDGYRIERVDYEVEPGDRVPALVLVPEGVDARHPAPAIAVWHQHNGEWHLGKSEPAGLAGNPAQHTGVQLAREGYVVLCPDALCFEERRSPHLANGDYERFEFLRLTVAGKCMAWKNILDMRRAVDYLCSRPDVRADRLGCYGHSMGSTHTWLVGPWEERLVCLVGNCCLPTYAAIHRTHILHCFPNFIPGLFAHGDTPDVAALIAPRPLLLNFGATDAGSPIAEVRQGVETIAAAYRAAGAADHFAAFIEPDVGHVLSPAMWEQTRGWFRRVLHEA
jgi:dienelactone hydrolase